MHQTVTVYALTMTVISSLSSCERVQSMVPGTAERYSLYRRSESLCAASFRVPTASVWPSCTETAVGTGQVKNRSYPLKNAIVFVEWEVVEWVLHQAATEQLQDQTVSSDVEVHGRSGGMEHRFPDVAASTFTQCVCLEVETSSL